MTVGFNARLFANDWRPAREEIAFAHAQGFGALQFRGPEHGFRFGFEHNEPSLGLFATPELIDSGERLRSAIVAASQTVHLSTNQ